MSVNMLAMSSSVSWWLYLLRLTKPYSVSITSRSSRGGRRKVWVERSSPDAFGGSRRTVLVSG